MQRKANIIDLGMMFSLKELNNPLTNIILSVDLLEQSDTADLGACHEIIKRNSALLVASLKEMYTCLVENYEEAGLRDVGMTEPFQEEAAAAARYHLKTPPGQGMI